MRRILIILVSLLVLLAVAYTVYWNVMASRSGDWVAYWAAPAPGKAWSGTYGETEVSGFPFALDVTVHDPVITWQGGAGDAVWQGPYLVAKFKPWTLSSFSFDLPPEQTVLIDDGTRLRMVALAMASGTARVAMADGRAQALHAEFVDLVASHEQNAGPITADFAVIDVAVVAGEPAHDVNIRVEGLGLAGQVAPPFEGHVPLASTSFRWVGDLASHGNLQSRLEGWRAEGGIVDVHALRLDWPPLEVDATGTLALDTLLRPIGAFRAEVVGYRELMEAMQAVGMLGRSEADMAGAALDFMARTQDDGTRRLAVDVSMQHGMLAVGPIPVMPLPPVLPPEAGF
jgi:hypothetical protein